MNQSACKVSVVIPCFNQGHYLDEAIDSVLAQTFQDFEIVVVNDGSTDPTTIKLLQNYDRPKTKVIHTDNQGLAAARNNGIQVATGEYILPLDSDDKVGDSYLEKAIKILDSNSEMGVVYCEAEYFGDRTGKWPLEEYRFPEILLENVIFCSGLYRRSDWESVGGYRNNMIYGWEDYDFWLALIELGRQVYRIPEVLFFYRQVGESMSKNMAIEHLIHSHTQLYKNHPHLYSENISFLFKRLSEQNGNLESVKAQRQYFELAFEQSQAKLHQTQTELGKAYQALEGAQDFLQQTQAVLHRTQEVLGQTQGELERSQAETRQLQRVLEAMRTSKFWKVRDSWFRLKRKLGLPIEDELS